MVALSPTLSTNSTVLTVPFCCCGCASKKRKLALFSCTLMERNQYPMKIFMILGLWNMKMSPGLSLTLLGSLNLKYFEVIY